MPPDEPTSVALAHIDGRLDTLTQTIAIRLEQIGNDAEAAKASAKSAHQRLDTEGQTLRDEFRSEVRELHKIVGEIKRSQARMVGIGLGIGASSGLVSGLVILLLSSAS